MANENSSDTVSLLTTLSYSQIKNDLAEVLDIEELVEELLPEVPGLPVALEAALHLPHTVVL